MSEQEPYELGKTGLHTMKQLRRHIQIFLERPSLSGDETRDVMMMELLLHIHDRLVDIEGHLASLSSESSDMWNKHFNS